MAAEWAYMENGSRYAALMQRRNAANDRFATGEKLNGRAIKIGVDIWHQTYVQKMNALSSVKVVEFTEDELLTELYEICELHPVHNLKTVARWRGVATFGKDIKNITVYDDWQASLLRLASNRNFKRDETVVFEPAVYAKIRKTDGGYRVESVMVDGKEVNRDNYKELYAQWYDKRSA